MWTSEECVFFRAKNTKHKNHEMQMKQIFWLSKCKSLIFITSTSCFGHVYFFSSVAAHFYLSLSIYFECLIQCVVWFDVLYILHSWNCIKMLNMLFLNNKFVCGILILIRIRFFLWSCCCYIFFFDIIWFARGYF